MPINCEKIQAALSGNFAGRAALWLLSLGYRLGMACRTGLYNIGLLKSMSVDARVVCIGNITTGGTGKTTAVILAATALAECGCKVAVVSRGYRRPDGKDDLIVLSPECVSGLL